MTTRSVPKHVTLRALQTSGARFKCKHWKSSKTDKTRFIIFK